MKAARWLLIVAVSYTAACAWWMAGRRGVEQVDVLTFSHQLHAENDVECDDCHGEAAAAVDLSKTLLPGEEACMECHDREDNCDMCHSNAEQRRPREPFSSRLHFAHKNHLERVEKGCLTCHPNATTAETLPLGRPVMDTCTGCHNHGSDYAEARCDKCHDGLRQVPLTAVAEFSHAGDWIARHGMLARTQGASCLQCHTQTTCGECHSKYAPAAGIRLFPEQVERTLLHRGDWLTIHPLEARTSGDTCTRCHQPSTCESCHFYSGVTPQSDTPRAPHPPGYARPGNPIFHGDDARVSIETCAACHDQGAASSCVTCHRVGGVGGDPHPLGWRDRHTLSEAADTPMCLSCH